MALPVGEHSVVVGLVLEDDNEGELQERVQEPASNGQPQLPHRVRRSAAMAKVLMAPVRCLARPPCCTGWNAMLVSFVCLLFAATSIAAGIMELKNQQNNAVQPHIAPIFLFAIAGALFSASVGIAVASICQITHSGFAPDDSFSNNRYPSRRRYQYPSHTARPSKRTHRGLAKQDLEDLFARSRQLTSPEDVHWYCAICLEQGGGGREVEEAAAADGTRDGVDGRGGYDQETPRGVFQSQTQPNGGSLAGCSIAQDTIPSSCGVELNCGHRFHRACLATWLARAATCPICVCDLTIQLRTKKDLLDKRPSLA